MTEHGKAGFRSWIVIILFLGMIVGAVESCATKHHRRQELIFPEGAYFSRDKIANEPDVIFQIFSNQTNGSMMTFIWDGGRSAEMPVLIGKGNDIIDKNGRSVGYIIVNRDGSFNIKGSEVANGHYVGQDGAVMSYKGKKQKNRLTASGGNDAISDAGAAIPSWLDGTWIAYDTPVGDAVITIQGNTLIENVGGQSKTGTISIGEDYVQVSYLDDSGVRLDLDWENQRIGLGEGWWLDKDASLSSDSHFADDATGIEKFFRDFPYIYDIQKEIVSRAGYAFITSGDKLGLADDSGNTLLPPRYDCMELTKDGRYALVIQGEYKGLFSTGGREILPVEYTSIASLRVESSSGGLGDYGDFVDGMDTDPWLYVAKDGKTGVADKEGVFLCEVKYEQVLWPDSPDAGIWLCVRAGGVDIVDYRFRTVKEIECEESRPSMDSYCSIRRNGKWGVVDSRGQFVIDPVYDEIPPQSDRDMYCLTNSGNKDLAVIRDGKYGIIGLDGSVLLPFEYDYIDTCPMMNDSGESFRRLFVGKNEDWSFDGKWGLYKDGKIIAPCVHSADEVNQMIRSQQ